MVMALRPCQDFRVISDSMIAVRVCSTSVAPSIFFSFNIPTRSIIASYARVALATLAGFERLVVSPTT